MNRIDGHPNSAIWLLADSNPVAWQDHLDVPLDRRFPTRHNIWTPIEKVIQHRLFCECKSRLNDKFYIRNAVEDPCHKIEKEPLAAEILEFRSLMNIHQPFMVLCFGQFAFEFARRAREEKEKYPPRHWNVDRLAEQFSDRVSAIQGGPLNVLPLLHASIARQFQKCHQKFSGGNGDYFEYVGGKIARVLIEHRNDLRLSGCWM